MFNSSVFFRDTVITHSWSRKVDSVILKNIFDSNPLKQQLLTRVVSAVALPVAHLADFFFCIGNYAKAKFFGKQWIVEPSKENLGISIEEYKKEGKRHLKVIVSSIFYGIFNPVRALSLSEDFDKKLKACSSISKGITYSTPAFSRLGDHVSCYLSAKWIAHTLKLPLVVRVFPHMNELAMFKNAKCFYPPCLPISTKKIEKGCFNENMRLKIEKAKEGIFETPFLYDAGVDWTDQEFRQSVIDDLSTLDNKKLPELRKDCLNVAIHYRDGGTFDDEMIKYSLPLKFPPMEYYQQQMKYILERFSDRNVHFEIFTDKIDHASLKVAFQEFAKKLAKGNQKVSVDYNDLEKDLEKKVVTDMIGMSKYDCLVRADSGLSRFSGLIGNLKLEILPSHSNFVAFPKTWFQSTVVTTIDKVTILERDGAGNPSRKTVDSNFKKSITANKLYMHSLTKLKVLMG